jgi:TRAP-type C4-dicarboxylate transport system substrate-binding protein
MTWAGGPEAISPFEQMAALGKGVFDFLFSALAYYEPIIPENSAAPLLNVEQARESGFDNFINDLHQKKANVFFLGRTDQMGYVFYTTKQVNKIADFKGLRLRGTPSMIPMIKALGASPITLAMPEVYSALERGVIDGLGLPFIGVVDYGYVDIIKYYVKQPFGYSVGGFSVNLDTWNRLPKDIQTLMKQLTRETQEDMSARESRLLAREEAVMREKGVVFVDLPPAEKEEYLRLAREAGWEYVNKRVSKDSFNSISKMLKRQ